MMPQSQVYLSCSEWGQDEVDCQDPYQAVIYDSISTGEWLLVISERSYIGRVGE